MTKSKERKIKINVSKERKMRCVNIAQNFIDQNLKNNTTSIQNVKEHDAKTNTITYIIFYKYSSGYLMIALNATMDIKKSWHSGLNNSSNNIEILPIKSKSIQTSQFLNIANNLKDNVLQWYVNDGKLLKSIVRDIPNKLTIFDNLNILQVLKMLKTKYTDSYILKDNSYKHLNENINLKINIIKTIQFDLKGTNSGVVKRDDSQTTQHNETPKNVSEIKKPIKNKIKKHSTNINDNITNELTLSFENMKLLDSNITKKTYVKFINEYQRLGSLSM